MSVYRWLLRLYPRSFREEYAAEMEAVFARRVRHGAVAAWAEVVVDAAVNAPGAHWDVLRQDVRYCARSLSRAPGCAATVVAITALAVGAASTVLSVADRVFLHPLPYAEPERLVRLWESKPGYQMELSPPNFRDWKAAATSFASFSAWRGRAVNLTGGERPVHLEGASVTADLFETLGVKPLAGRGFSAEDDRLDTPATVILSERLWREQFGGSHAVVGSSVQLDGMPHRVIGVMPGFVQFPSRLAEFWTPMRFEPGDFEDRTNNYLHGLARLKPGVPLEQAAQEMTVIAKRLEREYPNENKDTGAVLVELRDQVGRQPRLLLWALAGAAVCFLAIACFNLASLFVARSVARRRELAIRTALGAGAERLVRQLATESFVLALAGGAAGLLIAAAALPALASLVPTTLPVDAPRLDWRSAGWTFLLALGSALVFGVLPAGGASRGDTVEGLREGARQGVGGRKQSGRAALVVAEVSVSLALLVAAGLLIRALANVRAVDPGFRTEGVLTLRTPLPMPRYEMTDVRTQFYRRVLGEIESLPGVRRAAYTSFLPMAMKGGIWAVSIGPVTEVRSEYHTASLRFVTPGYFDAMGIPVVRGRVVEESDRIGTRMAAVVSESFVRRYWAGRDPIGQRFKIGDAEREVVGVVGDVRVRGLERQSEPQVYVPYRQAEDRSYVWYAPKDLVVAGATAGLAPEIRRIIQRADPDQPVTNVQWLSELVDNDASARRLQVRLLAAFAGLAVVLAGIGLYGFAAYGVSQRTQEFGVRLALGSSRAGIFGLVVRESVVLTAAGVVLGAGLGIAAARWLEGLLFGVPAWDAATWAGAVAVCVGTTMVGALVPAGRASRVDPMTAMRRE
ncbi:MAG: ABC transporter permease [Bryobacteraceae bacterium]|nr:ABC transporter permease [Bryobacteraceae bacterium]